MHWAAKTVLTISVASVALTLTSCGRSENAAVAAVPVEQVPGVPSPERSHPLDQYTAINDTQTLTAIALAFSTLPVKDDQKLNLVPDAHGATDAFARRDLLAKNLPEVNARLDAVRKQRYYRVTPSGPMPMMTPDHKVIAWSGGRILLEAYDFDAKGFPVSCLTGASILTNRTKQENFFETVEFRPSAPKFAPTATRKSMCMLPVSDEALAKKIETARAASNGVLTAGTTTLYFYVVDSLPGGWPSSINAVLTHVDLTLLDPAGQKGATALATISFEP